MATELTTEEYLAKVREDWIAEQPIRDKIKNKKNKVAEELIGLGISKKTAELLVGIHRFDEDVIDE